MGFRSSVTLTSTRRRDLSTLNTASGQKQLLHSLDGNQETSLQLGMRF